MPKIPPKASVVIPAYNEEETISDCIKSIQEQKTSFPFEIIVVNNASTDATQSVAKKLGVRVVSEKRKGLCFARQKGLDQASGEILVYVDADTRLPKDWLQAVIAYLDTHSNVVGVSCFFHFYDGTLLIKIGEALSRYVLLPVNNAILRFFNRPDFFFGSAFALRRSELIAAGGVNLDFPFYGEDIAMALRLSTRGKVRCLPDIFVLTSARRYYRLGNFRALKRYYSVFLMLELGKYAKAKQYADSYNDEQFT